MEKRNILTPVLIGAMLLIGTSFPLIGTAERSFKDNAIPVFTGKCFDYGAGRFEIFFGGAVTAHILLGAAAFLSIIVSKNYSARGKVLRSAAFVLSGFLHLFILICAYAFSSQTSAERWADNYYPEYYVVSDRDDTVRILFEEGVFLFDAHTNVYCLDEQNHAYLIGFFTADDAMTQNGEYDIVRDGRYISFEYDHGTSGKNGGQNIKTEIMELPDFVTDA